MLLVQQAADDGLLNPDGTALDMKARLDPWLNQMGFPLVTIVRSADGTALVSREHFLNPPSQNMETTSPYK